MDGKFISYLRVSTDGQGADGHGIVAQRAAIATHLNGGDWRLLGEFVEVESGKRADNRPQLTAALARCRLTGATLIVAKLDRLARNVAFLANLMDSGTEFIACDNPHANRFTLHILAAVAEHEREAISRRTKEALAAAKARGGKLGGDRGFRATPAMAEHARAARQAAADANAAEVGPIARQMRGEGHSLRQIAAALTAQGIRTPGCGSKWEATTVRNLLARAGV